MKLMERLPTKLSLKAGSEKGQRGIISYAIAWILGVPVTLLIVIYLLFNR